MTGAEFKKQIDRLTSTYGPKTYPQERADLLWQEFKSLDGATFEKIISRLIIEFSAAPMISRFREVAVQIREWEAAQQKKNHSADAKGTLSRIHHNPESYSTFAEYVVRMVESNDKEALREAINFYGMSKIDQIYERAKKRARA